MIVKPRAGSGSRGIRLIERRAELEALERDGTLLVQEHLPGPGVLARRARARRRAGRRASCPRERLKVDSGIAVTGRTLHDEALETLRARGRDADRPDHRRQRPGQGRRRPASRPCSRSTRASPGTMPLTIAAGVDMPRLAIGEALGHADPRRPAAVRGHRDGALLPGAVLRVRRHRGPAAPRGGDRVVNALADMHVHSTFSDGRDRSRTTSPSAEALGLAALGCVDHVRVDTDWVPELRRGGPAAARRHRGAAALRDRGEAARHDGRARPARTASTAWTRSTPPTTRCRCPRARPIRARCASGSRPATSAPRRWSTRS